MEKIGDVWQKPQLGHIHTAVLQFVTSVCTIGDTVTHIHGLQTHGTLVTAVVGRFTFWAGYAITVKMTPGARA